MMDDFLAQVRQMAKDGERAARKAKAAKKQKEQLTKEEERQRRFDPVYKNSPWIAEALIALFTVQTCKCCQHTTVIPAARQLFIRYRHGRLGHTWEKQLLEFQEDFDRLPRITREFEMDVEYCINCYREVKLPAPYPRASDTPLWRNEKLLHDIDVKEERRYPPKGEDDV